MKKSFYFLVLLSFILVISSVSFSQVKLGVMSYSYRHLPYEEMLQQLQRMNVHYVELYEGHVSYKEYSPEDAPKIIQTAKKYGVIIDVYHAGPEEEQDWDRMFQFAKSLGVKVISSAVDMDYCGVAGKYAKKYGLKFSLHNHFVPMGRSNKWKTLEYYRDFEKIVKEYPDPVIGFNTDNGHIAISGGDPLYVLEKYFDRTYHVHFKDYIMSSRRIDAPFGTGAGKNLESLKFLKDNGYRYQSAIEYERTDVDPFLEIRNFIIQSKKVLGTFNPVSPNRGYAPEFKYKTIEEKFQGGRPTVCLVNDVNKDGKKDIIIGSFDEDNNLIWYENPNWKPHFIAKVNLEAGGTLIDINRDRRLDIIGGNNYKGNELYWIEAPKDENQKWKVHLIDKEFYKYHDQAFGDVDGDGKQELIILTQRDKKVIIYDIPENPEREPWPKETRNIVADGIEVEGVSAVDIDRDGIMDIVCGGYWFKNIKGEPNRWITQHFSSLEKTKLAAGDINNDSYPDIVLAEGESDNGRLAWYSGPEYKEHLLDENLFHPHTLFIEDFDHDDHQDIIIGEMGLKDYASKARLIFYHNKGNGTGFEKTVVSTGIPTHSSVCTDIDNDGDIDIICKSFATGLIGIWYNQER